MIGDVILWVAERFLDYRERFKAAQRDRRDRIADYFEHIATCLEKISEELRLDRIPHGSCAEIEEYAKNLPDVIKEDIGSEKAEELSAKLHLAHEVERLAIDSKERAQLHKIDEASGKFRALSSYIRAAPID